LSLDLARGPRESECEPWQPSPPACSLLPLKGYLMRLTTSLKAVALMIVLGLAACGPASAEGNPSDAKLQAFVAAAVSASMVIEQWTPRIDSAESQEAIEELLEQANAELSAAIDGTDGITLDGYKEIAQAAQGDPGLSTRIEEIFKQEFRE
jgi:Domain of unknown function (DUF4168)